MATVTDLVTETSLRLTAIAHGIADVVVVPMTTPERPGAMDAGSWYVLSVKRNADSEWEVIGRRRTYGELAQLIKDAN